MLKLKYDLTGKDATFLSNCHRYWSGLSVLELYRNHPEKLFPLEVIKGRIDTFQVTFEGALNGDRVQAALRKKARKALTDMFNKILHYLQSVADEDDIPALLQAGIELRRPTSKRRTEIVPAT